MNSPPTPEPHTPSSRPEHLLEARGLSMRFGPVAALDGVNFSLRAGEIHALMGENGAGKSTLIKCLTGVHSPTAGEIRLEGHPSRFTSPRDAEAAGIAPVYQEVGLIPHMSIAENICLGREPVHRFWPHPIAWKRVRDRARAALARLGLSDLDVRSELGASSIAIQQLVAIARALDMNPRVLILDEPTSSLDRDECSHLFDVLRRLRVDGLGIIFITHVLDQVDAVADRITVLRDGCLVGVADARTLPRAALVSMMVGREFDQLPVSGAGTTTPHMDLPLLTAHAIGRSGSLDHVDLSIAPGEAVGLAGLLGSGRTETARLLFGADAADRGELRVHGRPCRFSAPREAIAHGLAFTSENRKTEGIIPNLSVRENICLALQAKRGLAHRIPSSEQNRIAREYIALLGIKTRDTETPITSLSGGNQQKTLLARWLITTPALLILDEPTRGIDIAAKADILRAIHDMRSRGMAVLFISSELEEVVRTCSRVVVLRDRRSIAELAGADVTEPTILNAIAQRHA